jgi:endoglucanase
MRSLIRFAVITAGSAFLISCSGERSGAGDEPVLGRVAQAATLQDSTGWHTHGTKIYPPTDLHGPGVESPEPGEEPFRIEAISWYGFETRDGVAHGLWTSDYTTIVDLIASSGFNTIRIPFSNEMWADTSKPRNVAACSECEGKTGKEILGLIIGYADFVGLKVILDNHRSTAGNSAEGNGLWYTDDFPESAWIQHWREIQEWVNFNHWSDAVVAYELRNEPHTVDRGKNSGYLNGSTWGTGDGATGPNPNPFLLDCVASSTCHDWRLAAERVGTLLLGDAVASYTGPDCENGCWPLPLIMVGGIGQYPADGTVPADNVMDGGWWGGMLKGVNGNSTNDGAPVVFNLGWYEKSGESGELGAPINGQLIYSAHDYGPDLYQQPWFNASTCYASGCGGDSLVDLWYGLWGFVTDNVNPVPTQSYPWDNTGGDYTGYGAAPLFVGEFGTGNTQEDLESTVNGSQGQWFSSLVELIRDSSDASADSTGLGDDQAINDLSWGYWSLNGDDSYGLLNRDFDAVENPAKVSALCGIQTAGCGGSGGSSGSGGSGGSAGSGGSGDCGDGICSSGEDCHTCPTDCEGLTTGKPSNRWCCGNEVLEPPEGDGSICDGNY